MFVKDISKDIQHNPTNMRSPTIGPLINPYNPKMALLKCFVGMKLIHLIHFVQTNDMGQSSLTYTFTNIDCWGIIVLVDKFLLTSNDRDKIIALKAYLDITFKIKDLGFANYFVGLEILKAKCGLILA